MLKRCFWNLLKTKKKGCLKQGKPLRNVRLGSLQATRPNSRKRCLGRACEKAEPQQVFVPKPLRNRSRKNAETSLLEPGFAVAWALNLLGFCLFACAPQTPFSWVWPGGLQASKSYVAQRFALLEATFFSLFLVGSKSNVSAVSWLRFRMVWALYFFLFSGFQKRRFGIFLAAVSQWLGHKTCWGSAFSHARPKHLFLEFGLVACRLFLCF